MNCISPFWATCKIGFWSDDLNMYVREVPVPCNQCPACVERRIRQYAFMMEQEYKRSQTAHFITLTYNQAKIPHYYGENGLVMHLQRKDLQDFFKRLRSFQERRKTPSAEEFKILTFQGKKVTKDTRLTMPPIKYFACGEYGQDGRPHYHICLFNGLTVSIEHAWQGMGILDIRRFNTQRALYTAKYLSKGKEAFWKDDSKKNEKPFHVRSSFLGDNYIDEYKPWHLKSLKERSYVSLGNGTKVSMPETFKDRIYTEEQRVMLRHYATAQSVETKNDKIKYFNRLGISYDEGILSEHKALFNLFDKNFNRL